MNSIHKIRSIISLRRKTKSSSSEELLQEITYLFVDILEEITKHTDIYTKQASSHRVDRIRKLVNRIKFLLRSLINPNKKVAINRVKRLVNGIRSLLRLLINPKKKAVSIILFIDNYEGIEHFLNPWLLNILSNKSYEVLAGKVKLVIAGRRKLSSHAFPDPCTRLTFQYVERWTEDHAKSYLTKKGITDSKHRELILELSGWLPRWLSVLASEYSSIKDIADSKHRELIRERSGRLTHEYSSIAQISPHAIFSKTLLQRFLELYVEDPDQHQFILEVALARKFNFYVISELLDKQAAKYTFDLLTALPFIKQDSYGFYYFPSSIRELMLSLLWELLNSDVQRWSECHEKLARYYKVSLNFGSNYAHWNVDQWSPIWQRCIQFPIVEHYVLEAVYHDLCRFYPGNIQVMLNSLCAAAQVSGQLGVRLAQTIGQAARDCRY